MFRFYCTMDIQISEKKKYNVPKEILIHIQKRKELQKRHQRNVKNGDTDFAFLMELKKHNNLCNKIIKKAVREKKAKRL